MLNLTDFYSIRRFFHISGDIYSIYKHKASPKHIEMIYLYSKITVLNKVF